MMPAMARAIEQDLNNRSDCYYFALCESCLLIARILESNEGYGIMYCHRCLEKQKLSIIPIGLDEIDIFTESKV